MKKNDIEKLLDNLSKKESEVQTALENLKPNELSDAGRKEMIASVERMIDKIEKWKSKPQEDILHKKAS